MDYSALIVIAIAALGCGLIALSVILPMAVRLPERMHDQWRLQAESELASRQNDAAVNYSYTTLQKTLLVIGAAVVGASAFWKYGGETQGIAYSFYFLSLILLVAINLKHQLLPDVVVLTSMWVGLIFQASSGNSTDAVYGAAIAFAAPFLVSSAVRMKSGHEIVGRGDLKALAMAGAWFGASTMPVLFISFVGGFAAWLLVAKLCRVDLSGGIPTGPAHLIASLFMASGLAFF